MFTIYYGESMTDLMLATPKGTPVFENIFPSDSFPTFPECWKLLDDSIHPIVICRTTDAVLCMPEGTKIIRVGRSVAESNRDELVLTPVTLEGFKILHR